MIYSEIRERVIEGVIRQSTDPPPLDRLRMIFDASFFQVNSLVADAFAARNDRREMLRVVDALTFAAGTVAIPSNVLMKFIADCTLTVGTTLYGFRKYPDYLRGGGDARLGKWTTIGENLFAIKPLGAGVLTGAASFSSIQAPPVPATESAEFVAPEDFLPEFIDAMINYILGQQAKVAAEST